MADYRWTQADLDAFKRKNGHAGAVDTLGIAPSTDKPQKYRAKPKIVDNIRFDSTKEADRYGELKLLELAGVIRSLDLQPRFDLVTIRGDVVGFYVADFRYVEVDTGRVVIEDTKSPATMTPLYKLKKKIAESCHKMTITEL